MFQASLRSASVVLMLVAVGCSGGDDAPAPPVLTAIDELRGLQEEMAAQAQADAVAAAAKANENSEAAGDGPSADPNVPATGTYEVEFDTTVGKFTIQVNRASAPIGAHRFYELVKAGFYNDCGFFRVVPNFVVQFGLAADPAMTAKWKMEIPDEPVIDGNRKGTLTFAKGGPNSRTTQVFINLKDNSQSLDGQGFPSFGKVIKGMDVVEKITSRHGEGPDQGAITSQGNEYLKSAFPGLDYVTTATITVDDQPQLP